MKITSTGSSRPGAALIIRMSLLAGGAALLLAGCAPGAPASQPQGSAPAPARVTKTVSLSSRLENRDGIALFSTQNADQRGTAAIFHAGLTVYDVQGRLQPVLAQKVPSVTDGDWKVNPDGSMEVTWKIKPNAKWHD